MFVGNDGGLYRTTNARAAVGANTPVPGNCTTGASAVSWTSLNNGYGVTQFYHGLPYPNGATYFGGTQDNGTIRGSDSSGANAWNEIQGGDGGYVAVDPTNTNILYAEFTGISIRKSTDGGVRFSDATTGISDRGLFINPFIMDPVNPQRLWTGGQFMWRTDNGAGNWVRASQQITPGNVSAIAVAPSNPNLVLAGTSSGRIARTTAGATADAATNWSFSQTPRGLNAGYISWLAFDPTNANIAYATVSSFNWAPPAVGHVFKSVDGGQNWTSIDGSGATGIPDIPVHCIVVDPANSSRLFVGTDLGVFASIDGGATWAVENTGFANVVTESLAVNRTATATNLFAFTHGRGAWRVNIDSGGGANCLTVTSINPASGAAGTNVTTTGANFTGVTAVRFANNVAAQFTVNSDEQITAIVPAGAVTGPITISKPNCPEATTAVFTVSGSCTYSINPASQNFSASGGTGSVAVTSPSGCAWTAASNASWITITSGASGSGNGAVNYSVAANTSASQRSGTMTIAGQTFTVTQSGGSGCAYSISPTSRSFSVSGGTGAVTVNTTSGCAWTATSNDSWLTITAGASGSGPGTVNYSVAANPGASPRNGTMTIAGQTFFVFQSGCVSFNVYSRYFETSGGTGSFSVFAASGCAWTAVSSASWLTLTGPTSGNGNDTITYSVAANTGSPARGATINVSGNIYYVDQRGSGSACTATPITLGQTVNGSLSASDCLSPSRGIFGTPYADRYTFSGVSGQRIAILQNSTAIDSYVFLIGPDGTILYRDDDGGGYPNSRIPPVTGFYRLPATGTYIVEATSYSSGRTGDYTLSLNTTCVDLSPVSQTFTSNGGSASATVTAPSGCAWTATSDASWLTVNSGSGNGNGTINYSVAPNSTGSLRRATLAIAGDVFVVNQSSDSLALSVDDGTIEDSLGYGGGDGYYVNRLTPTSYPATLSAVSIYFPVGRIQVGDQITILAGSNPSGADNINNVAFQTVNATVQRLGEFNVFTVPQQTITSGDFVVGFRSSAAFPCPIDLSGPALRRSYVSFSGASFLRIEDANPYLISNFGIRALLAQAACTYAINPTSQSFSASGGAGSVAVTSPSGCAWTAASNASWITITSGSSGAGNGTVNYSVAANTSVSQRTGAITIAGQTFTVTQSGGGGGGCTYSIFPTSKITNANSDRDAVNVVTQSGCAWTAVSNAAWITFTTAASGTGNGLVGYAVAANNTGAARTGTLIVAGHTFTHTQSACAFTLNPAGQSFGVGGGRGAINLTTQSDCTWTATTTDAWINIISGAIGSGNGVVGFDVAANNGPARTGAINVAGRTFTVTQAGQSCSYTISPTSQSFQAAGGAGQVQVNVTTGTGCNWTATSNASWITITSGANGSGSGSVSYAVAANTSANSRTGTLTIAGQTFTVTQSGSATTARALRAGAASGAPGGSVSVPIELLAQGDESALGFSLTFDPAILSNPQATLGADSSGASLNTNGSQAGQGRFGVAVALPSGQRFNAGTRQVVNVTFAIATGVSVNSTPIGFGDQPVPREISDTGANSLPANYVAGAVTLAQGFEADVAPRPSGNGSVTITDWVQIGRFIAGTDTPNPGSEFQRADVAPRASLGDGRLTITDWVQAGRYVSGEDAVVAAGGPTNPSSSATAEADALRLDPSVAQQTTRTLRIVQASLERGQSGALIVELAAQGNESALGFSLSFDPAQLRFVSAALGNGAAGATLNLNTNQTANRRLGVALALPNGQTLAAGARQLLVITFVASANGNPATTTVGFVDQPVPREVSDRGANALPTTYAAGTVQLTRSVANVSAASFLGQSLASESIVAAFGSNLATGVGVASSLPLPTTLLGTTVRVRDSLGVERLAPLFFVAPTQVNYQIPPGSALGTAVVTITSGDGVSSSGQVRIDRVAPGLMSANGNGQGVAAAVALRVRDDGAQSFEPVARFDAALGRFVPLPLDLGPTNEQVYLILYGAGFRFRNNLADTAVRIGGVDVMTLFAGAAPGFVGLDQINLGPIPRSLAGRGEVGINVTVEGKAANVVRISIL